MEISILADYDRGHSYPGWELDGIDPGIERPELDAPIAPILCGECKHFAPSYGDRSIGRCGKKNQLRYCPVSGWSRKPVTSLSIACNEGELNDEF